MLEACIPFATTQSSQKLEDWLIRWRKKFDVMCIRLDTITTLDRRTDGRIDIVYQIRGSPAIKVSHLHRALNGFCKKLPLYVRELILTVPCIVSNKVHLCLSPHSNQIVFTERQCCPTWSKVWRGYVVGFQVGCSPEPAEFTCNNHAVYRTPTSATVTMTVRTGPMRSTADTSTSRTDVILFYKIAVCICGYWILLRLYSMTSICAWETCHPSVTVDNVPPRACGPSIIAFSGVKFGGAKYYLLRKFLMYPRTSWGERDSEYNGSEGFCPFVWAWFNSTRTRRDTTVL